MKEVQSFDEVMKVIEGLSLSGVQAHYLVKRIAEQQRWAWTYWGVEDVRHLCPNDLGLTDEQLYEIACRCVDEDGHMEGFDEYAYELFGDEIEDEEDEPNGNTTEV